MNKAQILSAAIRAGLDPRCDPPPEVDDTTLRSLIHTAALSKTLPHVVRGYRRTSFGQENPLLSDALRTFELQALKTNTRILAAIGDVLGVLQGARIPVVVLKGPPLQQQLYGTFFLRPSGDLDLLVHRQDFKRCIAALGQLGFSSGHDISFWWRNFLGQEHLVRPGRLSWSIDLHHRVQQPDSSNPAAPSVSCRRPTV